MHTDDTRVDDPVFRSRYTLCEDLGEGGHGRVYRAIQRATGQSVAVKVIKLGARPARRLARFARETRLCAELHHPHIVRLRDAHRTETAAWAVFDWVPGYDLAAVLRARGALSPGLTVRLMSQLLDALAAAHGRGIVHRDVKPSNVMVVGTGAREHAMLLDFGVGALFGERRSDVTRLTQTGEAVGTPAYASPEQLRGRPPTARSDLYSWALTTIECLTGSRVIAGQHLTHIMVQQLGPQPIPLPSGLAEHPLGDVLRSALAKDPLARDVTAARLLDALDALDGGTLLPSSGWHATRRPAPPPAGGSTTVGPIEASPTEAADALARALGQHWADVTLVSCAFTAERQPGALPDAVDFALRAASADVIEIARWHGGWLAGLFGAVVHVAFDGASADERMQRAKATAHAIIERLDAPTGADEPPPAVRVRVGASLCTGPITPLDSLWGSPGMSLVGETAARADALVRRVTPGAVLLADAARPAASASGASTAGAREIPASLLARAGALAGSEEPS